MSRLYQSPLRVYLLLGFLALTGIVCGLKLPVSLYPNSSKPRAVVNIPYASLSAEEFVRTFGSDLETRLRGISTKSLEVERVEGNYRADSAHYEIDFKWGADSKEALREVQATVLAFASRLPAEARDGIGIHSRRDGGGFFALSFFSERRSTDELYALLEPLLTPRLIKIADAEEPVLWNPSKKEVRIELNPAAMANLQLLPRDVEQALNAALSGSNAGTVSMGMSRLSIEMPRQIRGIEDLAQISIPVPGSGERKSRTVHLGEIAQVDYGPSISGNMSFKTDGSSSLILFATPKAGGNVKKMSEELLAAVTSLSPQFPSDVQYRVLVDPSEFIRSAVSNVFHEVLIAALLAVIVLFLFIGSFKNVVTAAIEIPLSMVLAFILMRLFNMNMNLISLGGLALSAGMNVDASVVVMENIFRHFEKEKGILSQPQRLNILLRAVQEVKFPILASTIASLVVFLPLAFTSDLTYAILGDLALAVVFSHGFSMFVALILVPTIRLQLMQGPKGHQVGHSFLEPLFLRAEEYYVKWLALFLDSRMARYSSYLGCAALLVGLLTFVLPRLPKEIVGMPDTDWIVLDVSTDGNTRLQQMELQSDALEKDLRTLLGPLVRYTFSQLGSPNNAEILARLVDKKDMRTAWKKMEGHFTDTPTLNFHIEPWNPTELPIPHPPHFLASIRGSTAKARAETAEEIRLLLKEKKLYPRVWGEPDSTYQQELRLTPHREQWAVLQSEGARLNPVDLSDVIRVATQGRRLGGFPDERNQNVDVFLRYPPFRVESPEDVEAFPIGVRGKVVPLKALASVAVKESAPDIYREDGRELVYLKAKLDLQEESKKGIVLEQAKKLVAEWQKGRQEKLAQDPSGTFATSVTVEDADKDLTGAISQLQVAVALSIGLIFLTLLIQFGSVIEPMLVMVAVPLGLVGVLLSLFIFQSTLSLNSVLGVILLNGIAVANSIILVDFTKKLVGDGLDPRSAAIEAARTRLRPILMTSLTTVLGMLPIALGFGEGGRILQPLGIAVSGGLWFSMALTLFLVPALHCSYLCLPRFDWKRFNLRPKKAETLAAIALPFMLFSRFVYGAEIPAQSPLSFADAIEIVVARHPDVAAASARLAQTESANLSSHLTLLPSISLNGQAGYQDEGSGQFHTRSANGTAELNLFKFGADLYKMGAARKSERAALAQLEQSRLIAEAEAVRALVGILQAKAELTNWQQSYQVRNESLRIANERFRRGLLAKQESDKLLVEMENTRAGLRDAEANLAGAEAELEALLGEGLTTTTDWPWRQRLLKDSPKILAATVESLGQRPDWQAAQAQVEFAADQKGAALGAVLPSLDASFSYGYFRSDRGSFRSEGPQWQAGLVLTIPLFDRLDRWGKYRAEVHAVSSAEAALVKVKRLARKQWLSTRAAFTIALESAKDRDKTLAVSRSLYQNGMQRFRHGLVTADELGRDQERLYASELLAIRGWATVHTALTQLCHATGKRLLVCLADA